MNRKTIPLIDIIAPAGVIIMLVAFALMPWADVLYDSEAHMGETAFNIISAGKDTDILQMTTTRKLKPEEIVAGAPLMVFDKEGNMYEPERIRLRVYLSLFLVPLAAVGGGVLVVLEEMRPRQRRLAVWGRRVLAAGALIHYAIFLITYQSVDMVDIGFWLALVGAACLVFATTALPKPEASA
ncbi:MAG: hypothetical protein JXJ20_02315 [Anaerolineae bacterium]|nr:hypothetical protein [Anaerolineae bacterium]